MKVSIRLDGPVSQFKNKYILAILAPMQRKHGIEITWNFFPTSHSKGPVDGIGGAVKRLVWNAIRSRTVIVTNTSSFTERQLGQKNIQVTKMET